MTRTSALSKMMALMFVAVGLLFTACEPYQFQALKGTVTTEAKNAIDVLPADVMYVAMMNTQELKNNQHTDLFGDDGWLFNGLRGGDLAQLEDFMSATGFDPNEDLGEIYFAAAIKENNKSEFSLVAYASNEPEELQAYLENNAGDHIQKRDYKGIEIFEGKNDEAPSMSFVNEEMMIAASSGALLEDMIDRLQGDGSRSLASSDKMMNLITQASIGGGGWFVAKKPDTETAIGGGSDLEQSAQQIWNTLDYVVGAVNVETNGFDSQMYFYPNEGVAAKDMASLLNGMVAAAKAHPEFKDEQLDLLDDIRAKAAGDHVEMSMFVENNMIQAVNLR